MRQADFVHLHLHTAFSLLQSTIRLPQLMKRARDYRLPALAITDHGNLFGAVEFYDLAYSHGIKPIIGCELVVRPTAELDTEHAHRSDSASHLVLLARNKKGYQNLLRLITQAHSSGYQMEARISQSQLEDHCRGLVVLSGCQRGEIPTWFLKEDPQKARARAAEYLEILGRECFFIEIQPPLTDTHRLLNERLTTLARQLDLQVVATANSHTLDPDESELLRILAAIKLGISVDEIAPQAEHSFLSPEAMKAAFAHLPEAITATVEIAERCNLDLDLGKVYFPKFSLEKGQNVNDFLREQATEGLRERLPAEKEEIRPEYSERLERELKIVEQLGLADYFLVISDFVRFARGRGVPVGPGSGSAGSSLMAYALGITEIDPLLHGLLFERLVNPLTPEFPDIDLGIGAEMREEVHDYLRAKYGQDRVAQIVSLGTLQMRTATRDLEKVLIPPPEDLESSSKETDTSELGLRDLGSLEAPRQQDTQHGLLRRVSDLAAHLEGLPRQVSTHGTGLVIGDGPLVHRIPLYRGPKDEWVSQYNMHALKRVGLVKFDLIARKTLTVIRKTLALVESELDLTAAIRGLPEGDESAFALLCRGEITGIPYLESPRARDLLIKWQPSRLQDLLILLVLNRPTSLESGLTERMLQARKDGKLEESYPVSMTLELVGGAEILLFDVDISRLICRATGWSTERADQICRILMRSAEEQLEPSRMEFVAKVEEQGSSQEVGESIWQNLEYAAGLVSDKSRTVAQALTVLQAAFLKARFPEHYISSLLSSELRQQDLLAAHVESSRQEGFRLLPADINNSEVEFTVEEEGIRVGLAAIRQVSQATAEAIVQTRQENGPFSSLFELCAKVERKHLGRRALAALIKAGALDSFVCPRKKLVEMLPQVVEQARRGQMTLFDGCAPELQSPLELPESAEWHHSVKLAHEKEALGFYLSGHPLSEYRPLLQELAPGGTSRLRELPANSRGWLGGIVVQVKETSSRKDVALHFIRLEDFEGSLEVVVFADVLAESRKWVRKEAMILVSGRVVKEAGEVRLVADTIIPLEEAVMSFATSIHFHLHVEGISAQPLKELQQLISSHPGSCAVFLHLHIGQQVEAVQELPPTYSVRPTLEFRRRLAKTFGDGCLEIRYRSV